MAISTEEKIRIIEQSASFADVPQEAMPPSYKENYYFVSYSHKDYKEVLRDILRLEEMGVNIWYDHEMHIGENWREIAQLYISKFQCAGILFYLTENSLSSPACNQEVEYVLTHNKRFLSINKPLPGCGVQSGYGMLQELHKRGLPCSEELLDNFRRAFSDEVLYLPVDAPIEKKAQQILSIPKEDLLQFAQQDGGLSVLSCRDNTLLSLDLSKKQPYQDSSKDIVRVDDCVFTNSIKLQRVAVSPALREIGESAFRGCTSLSELDLSRTQGVSIGRSAFKNCSTLPGLDLSHTVRIGEESFAGCTAFRAETVSGEIGSRAFAGTPTVRVEVTGEPFLDRSAFALCRELREVRFAGPFTQDLPEDAFYDCEKLEQAGPFLASFTPQSDGRECLHVGGGCFHSCARLQQVRFEGAWSLDRALYAFDGCRALKKLELDITGVRIPAFFARHCESLAEVTHSERFIEIGEAAFAGCAALSAFALEHVRTLGKQAFAESGLKKAYLRDVQAIPQEAFAGARALRNVCIGEECREIGQDAFADCPALFSVRLLCRDVSFPARRGSCRVFGNTAIKVFYLRSPAVLEQLREEGVLGRLKILYIDEEMNLQGLSLAGFETVESDEAGFIRLDNPDVALPADAGTEVDITECELNKPDPRRENYSGNLRRFPNEPYSDLPSYLGEECEIRHARLQTPHIYFVEEVFPDSNGGLEALTVSVHSGKSFRLPGSLIEKILVQEDDRDTGIRIAGEDHMDISAFMVKTDIRTELDGKTCCVEGDGLFLYCLVRVAMVCHTPPPMVYPCRDADGHYTLKALVYEGEDGQLHAVSARDINRITVFGEDCEVEKVLQRQP